MSIIAFTPEDMLSDMPQIEQMDMKTLKEYRQRVQEAISNLDRAEPKDETSEAYDAWAEDHEELEDILDEILDRIEELS